MKDTMSPIEVDETADEASTTHHNPLHAIKEEEMDETSTTRHEPLFVQEEEAAEKEEADAAAATVKHDAAKGSPEHDVSLKLHRKVAEIAAKAYRRASEQSNVLSRAKLADIAMVKIEELEIGKFLGKGSFSNVQ